MNKHEHINKFSNTFPHSERVLAIRDMDISDVDTQPGELPHVAKPALETSVELEVPAEGDAPTSEA